MILERHEILGMIGYIMLHALAYPGGEEQDRMLLFKPEEYTQKDEELHERYKKTGDHNLYPADYPIILNAFEVCFAIVPGWEFITLMNPREYAVELYNRIVKAYEEETGVKYAKEVKFYD